MLIERNLTRFVILADDPVLTALNKISANKAGFVVAVTPSGRVKGIATDGDIRRWLASSEKIDLSVSIGDVVNIDCATAPISAPAGEIAALIDDRVRAVPLVDEYGRLIAIALRHSVDFSIGRHMIGKGKPSFIIAEIGNNHNGDTDLAKRLVDLAKEAGADCAKFQLRDIGSLYGGSCGSDAGQDLGSQYTLDLLARFNLSPDQLFKIFDHCRSVEIEPLCTPWDSVSLRALESYGVAGYKIASADLTNHGFLAELASTGKPLIVSTGMAQEYEIKESVRLLRAHGAPFVMLHCNSTYPTPFKDVNLKYMDRLAELSSGLVGYSGHERGWVVPVAAVARGACVVEKHFTIDRHMEGNDHKISLLPDEFSAMVKGIRAVEAAMGEGGSRVMTQGEMINREVLAKSIVAARDILPGTVITPDMLAVQSPGQGLQPNHRQALIGRTISREVKSRTPFFLSDLQEPLAGPRVFRFPRPWGVPVRWHDYRAMLAKTNMTMLEYHLSYKDLEAKLEDWFEDVLDIDYVVHAPELFAGDHVLDLASPNEAYRARSIAELQRTVDVSRALKHWHSRARIPAIIVNMGGFSQLGPLPVNDRPALYRRIEESLAQLNLEGVEIIPQTMPPFPWHFGGQSYHNLFIDADEIVDFCQRNKMRICFDVSHSQLACNHNGVSMKEFCEKVGPYTRHLHIVDAKGIDGEGLQIGEGMVDFAMLADVLDAECPDASFVPEIWQGHKDGGAGFWFALDKLEKWMGRSRIGREIVASSAYVAG